MNMNYNSMPYEANYSDDIMSMSPMGPGGAMPMGMPMGMSSAGMGQMQMPMGNMGNMGNMGGGMSGIPNMSNMTNMGNMGAMGMNQMSYPMQRVGMQSLPMGMMQGMQPQSNQIAMSMSQLPPGAVTPLNSVSVMPVMGGGGIDGGGMNVVMPDLQPMSQMGTNPSMSQMHHGRMAGGASQASNNWIQNGNSPHMWNYSQSYTPQHPMETQQQQHHHHHHQQQLMHQQHHHQQQQEEQNQHRMKAHYDYSKEARNGLNSPTSYNGLRLRNSSGYIGKKVSQLR